MIPIHLMELSPGSFRTFVVGISYQLGNLVSSASSTIEATIGERFPLPSIEKDGVEVERYKYGLVIAIFMGAVFLYVLVLTFIGPEMRGRSMGVAQDADLQEAAGSGAVDRVAHRPENRRGSYDSDAIEKN